MHPFLRTLAAVFLLGTATMLSACGTAAPRPRALADSTPASRVALTVPRQITHSAGRLNGKPAVSGDGRFVAFATSIALSPADTNDVGDVYVFDTKTGLLERASISDDGLQPTEWARDPAISRDGRYVAYVRGKGDPDGDTQESTSAVYVRDRLARATFMASSSPDGGIPNGLCSGPSISADGDRVAFVSQAANLVRGDAHAEHESGVYVRLVSGGKTVRVDVNSEGERANGDSSGAISADGRSIAISSAATNLVPNDTNGHSDVFLHDMNTGATTRVSVSASGEEANGDSAGACLSADGTRIAFYTDAANLIPGDTNGVSDVVLRDVAADLTVPVSVGASGTPTAVAGANPAFDGTFDVAISGNGRYVAYASNSSPLVGNRQYVGSEKPFDVYLRDTTTQRTLLVSDFGSIPATLAVSSFSPSLSDDGGLVAFVSNLAAERQTGRDRWQDEFFCRLLSGS